MISDFYAYTAHLSQPFRCPTCNRISTGEVLTRNGVPTLADLLEAHLLQIATGGQ